MEKIIKVSIGNMVFTLEKEAHKLLHDYLEQVGVHYRSTANSVEIVEGIEERIAVLIAERIKGENVVPVGVAKEVIAILGMPEDIDNEAGRNDREEQHVQKRLFRDPEHKILGGVCSGIAAYFRMDVVWIRLAFVVLCFLWGAVPFFTFQDGGVIVVFYVILWIIIPQARTLAQRYAMSGELPTLRNVQKHVEEELNAGGVRVNTSGRNSSRLLYYLGRIISVCMGALLSFVGIAGIITTMVVFLGLEISYPVLNDIAQVFFLRSEAMFVIFKVALFLTFLLPCAGMLYGGILLIFDFKAIRWRIGLVIFLLWVIALIFTVVAGAGGSFNYWKTKTEYITVTTEARDTLYIRFTGIDKWEDANYVAVSGSRYHYSAYYLDNNTKKDAKMAYYPEINLHKRNEKELVLRPKITLFQNNLKSAGYQSLKRMDFYQLDGDTLYLDPVVFRKGVAQERLVNRMDIYVGKKTKVIIEEPVYHDFTSSFKLNDFEKYFDMEID